MTGVCGQRTMGQGIKRKGGRGKRIFEAVDYEVVLLELGIKPNPLML